MKKITSLALFFFLIGQFAFAQQTLVTDDFDYGNSTGNLTDLSAQWKGHSGSGSFVQYNTNSLTFEGYVNSGVGGSISFSHGSGSRQDINYLFSSTGINSGAVYASMLINLSNAGGTSFTYFAHLMEDGGAVPNSFVFLGRMFVREGSAGATTFNIGISKSSTSNIEWSEDLAISGTYLVILKYLFKGDSNTDDTVNLFIIDGEIPASEPDTPDLTSTDLSTDAFVLKAIALRQGSGGTPTINLDGMRIATDWGGAIGQVNNPPVASNVDFTGTLKVGESLTGSYDWSDDDEADTESGSQYQWYRADDANGTNKEAICEAVALTYTPTLDDQDKYLSFEVTPGDGTGSGTAVESDAQGPVLNPPSLVSAVKSSNTTISLKLNKNVSVTTSVTSDFSVVDCRGNLYEVSAIQDATPNDNLIELTVASLESASGDITITYNKTTSVIEDANSSELETDATGLVISAVESYDISQIQYAGGGDSNLDLTGKGTIYSNVFNDDGSKLFVLGLNLGLGVSNVFEYSLSTAYDISTATETTSFEVTNEEQWANALAFSADGTQMYITGELEAKIFAYDLSTPFDLTTASYSSNSFTTNLYVTDIEFNSDGTSMFLIDANNSKVIQYSLSTAFDVTTASQSGSLTFDINTLGFVSDIAFKNDGSVLYAYSVDFNKIFEFNLVSPYVVSGASHINTSENLVGVSVYAMSFDANGEILNLSGDFSELLKYTIGDKTSPTMSSATMDSNTEITVTFSENVTVYESNPTDFTVTDGVGNTYEVSALADVTAGDDEVTLTVASLEEAVGDLTITYDGANSTVADFNCNDLSTDVTGVIIDIDQTAPTLVSATKDSDTQITLTFSEPVQIDAVDANNFIVEDGNSDSFCVLSLTDGTEGDNQLILGMSDLSSARIKITITYDPSSGNVRDFGGNNLASDATGVEITLDVTAPSGYSVSFDDDLLNASEATSAKFTFSDAEVGATYNYTVSSSGGGTDVTGSGTITTATDQITLADLSGLNDGELTLSVTLTDLSNNEGTAVTDNASLDSVSPTVTITSNASDPQSGAYTATFTFSEAVTGFEETDITVGNGVLSDFSATSTTVYTAIVTPSSDGIITLDVAANVATDAAGNNTRAANQLGVRNDETAPSLSITSPSIATNQAFTVTFTFSEDVTGFTSEDIEVNNAALSDFSAVSASVYTAIVTPRLVGEVTVDVGEGVAIDLAGNENTSANQLSIEYEVTKPELISVTLNDNTQPDDAMVYYTVEFSEAVNVSFSDFQVDQVSGFAEGVIIQVTNVSETEVLVGFHISGSLYNEGDQQIKLLISDDNNITDLAGNALGVVDNDANDIHTTNLTYEAQSSLLLTLEDDDLPDISIFRITTTSLGLLIPQLPQFYPDNKARVEIELENFNSFFEKYFTGPENQNWDTKITIRILVEEDGEFIEAAVVGGDLKLTGSSGDNREYGTFTLSSLNFVTLTEMSSTVGTINTALMRFKLNLASVGLVNVLNDRLQNFKYPLAPIMINEIGYHPDYPDSITYIELYDGGIGNITLRGGNVNEDHRNGAQKGGIYARISTYTENQRIARGIDLPQLEYPDNIITTDENGYYVIDLTDPSVSFYKEVAGIIPEVGRSRMYLSLGFGSNVSQELNYIDIEGRREAGYPYSLQRYHGNQRVRNDGLEWAYGIPTKGKLNTIFLQGDSLRLYENEEQTFVLRANGGNRVELTQGVTYAITGGPDQSLFEINESTGELSFKATQDFENPADADEDNEYLVDVTAYRDAPYNDGNTRTIVVEVMDLPNVEITSPVELTSGAFTATFTFSEDVTGFTSTDILVANATLSDFTATSASIYTALITPLTDGEVTLDVSADVAIDADNNGNEAAVQLKVINDETAPDAPILNLAAISDLGVSSSDRLTSDTTPEFKGTAEAGSTVEIFLDGSSKGTTVADSNGAWGFTISTSLPEGKKTITATATDLAGNTSTISNALEIIIDLSLSIGSTSPVDDASGILPNVNLSVTFDKNVVKGTGNIIIKQSSDNTVIETIDVSGDNVTVNGSTVTINPVGSLPTNTELYVNIDEGAFKNEAGAAFAGISANTSWTFTTVVASVVTSLEVPSNGTYKIGDNLDFKLNFSLPVSINGAPTLQLTIGTASVEATLQGTVTSANAATFRYTVVEGNLDTDGLVVAAALSLNGATIKDASNIDAATTLNNVGPTAAVLVDGVKPTPTISTTAAATINTAFSITVEFDEPVAGFGANDLTVTNGTASNFAVVSNNRIWTFDITPSVAGNVAMQVAAGAANDNAGNGNNASNIITRLYNRNPTDITLSPAIIRENNALGDVVGTLSSADADGADTHVYTLVSGTGDTDNASFSVEGSLLKANLVFDFETKDSYSLRVKTTDSHGGTFEKAITVNISNQEEAIIVVEGDGTFEETILGLSTTKNWTITNNGDAATEVRIISSAQGFSITPGSVQITPGETKNITAVFRPTQARVYTGLVVFNFDITDEIKSNVLEIGLSGEGVIVTGLDNGQISEELISVFPNPASTSINIDLSELHGMPVDIRMINPSGVSKLEREAYDKPGLTIDVANFESGLYIIQFSNEKSLVRKKVLIRK